MENGKEKGMETGNVNSIMIEKGLEQINVKRTTRIM